MKTDKEVVELFKKYGETRSGSVIPFGIKAFLKEEGLIKEEFEVGEYYFGCQIVALYTRENRGIDICSGEEVCMTNISMWRKLTNKEVEEALIKEAKKRYKEGDVVRCLCIKINEVLRKFKAEFVDGQLWLDSDDILGYGTKVFGEGKWAKVIKEEKKELSLEERIEALEKKCNI